MPPKGLPWLITSTRHMIKLLAYIQNANKLGRYARKYNVQNVNKDNVIRS